MTLPPRRNGGRAPAAAAPGEERIAPNNLRALQRRKMRHVKFDAKRQEIFLAHFCWSGDTAAAAAAAGVCENTVYNHGRREPAFKAEFQTALAQCYVRLEAEAVRQRLAAQQRLRAAIEESEPNALLSGEEAEDFDRVMKLLARWDRRGTEPGRREQRPSAERAWTFDEAILALEKRLRALGFIKPGDGPDPPD
jgi:hypothetical protein